MAMLPGGLEIGRRWLVALGGWAVLATAMAALAPAPAALAQPAWPSQPVRLVVPFAAGGSTDVVARIVADPLSKLWGQAVVIDNKPGAGTNLGNEAVAKAEPNGYTMLMASASLTTTRNLYPKLNYEISELAPVSMVCTFPLLLLTPPTSPIKTVADLITAARATPAKLSFGTPGLGTTPHLAGELLKQMTGVDITHVPYRGDAPALADTMGGRIDLQIGGTAMLEQVRGGQVRGLAVTTAKRTPAAPDVPSVGETVPGYDVPTWYAFFVPAKTPPAIVAKMNADVARVIAEPTLQARFAQISMIPGSSTPTELGAMVDSELKKWGAVIKTANIKLEP